MKCLCAGNQPHTDNKELTEVEPKYMMHWSKDGRTYVAVKPLQNCGALIYMAVAEDPNMGWDIASKTKTL